MEDVLRSRDYIITLIHENLQEAQARMKFFVDQRRIEREFDIGLPATNTLSANFCGSMQDPEALSTLLWSISNHTKG